MPHLRNRFLQDRLRKALQLSPIVGILGQRQVGKTTLMEGCASESISLDRERSLLLAEEDPEAFLEGHLAPFGIDEAQLCSRLFPALKERVRKHKTPGQFILTGSVRFTSREAIRESLTGRIVSLELLPFTLRETHEHTASKILFSLWKIKNQKQLDTFVSHSLFNISDFKKYLAVGGLPGIAFLRDASARTEKFESQLDTILNRDIRLIYPTTLLYPSLRRLLSFLAENQGQVFHLSEASREAQISTVTLPKVLYAMEALFLIRAVEVKGIKRTVYFLEDQGMASWLCQGALHSSRDILRGLYANLRQEIYYPSDLNWRFFQWRTRNGVEIPLVFEAGDKCVAVSITEDRMPTPKTIAAVRAFLKTHPKSKAFIVHGGSESRVLGENFFTLPFLSLL